MGHLVCPQRSGWPWDFEPTATKQMPVGKVISEPFEHWWDLAIIAKEQIFENQNSHVSIIKTK
jgi:hypothetical protein